MSQSENNAYKSISAKYGRLISTSIRCDGVTLAQFLQAARGSERYYWESSLENVAFAGMGTALELLEYGADRFKNIQRHAMTLFADAMVDSDEPLAAPRLFGGFSFRDDFVPDEAWANFTPAHFVLPHYQLVRVGEAMWLTLNAHMPYGESPAGLLPELREALRAKADELQELNYTLPAKLHASDIRYPMPYETWQANIMDATARMKQGDLNKVVLSRVSEVRFPERLLVDSALAYLADTYPETYRFLFEPRPYHAFYGATPELLANVQRKKVRTMALAGSMRRGASPDDDAALAEALLDSDKDRYEHQLVIDGILTRLESLGASIEVGKTDIMTLSNIHHIHTPIDANLKYPDGIVPVVEALHPTPALGGDPQDIAMNLIGEYEPVPRGWYAAPVGWIDRNLDGEFGVAIRSAVAQEKRVWLYAGAGIVRDSDPQKEWDETGLKFRPMLAALGSNED